MKKKNGFVFVETIIVVCILLASLMIVYSMYVTSLNLESRRLRYDDPAKLYQTYYIKKYIDSFDLSILKKKIKEGSNVEMIYSTRSDIFGDSYRQEAVFFENIWNNLNIKNIYLFSPTVSEIAKCTTHDVDGSPVKDAICTNNNLITYLKSVDDVESTPTNPKYILVIEYATTRDGTTCYGSDCVYYYYAHVTVGE